MVLARLQNRVKHLLNTGSSEKGDALYICNDVTLADWCIAAHAEKIVKAMPTYNHPYAPVWVEPSVHARGQLVNVDMRPLYPHRVVLACMSILAASFLS